jgi:dynein assembly factor 5
MKRKKAIESIEKEVLDCVPAHSADELSLIFQELYRPLLKLFGDGVDRNRELSANTVHRFCSQLGPSCGAFLPYIVPTVTQRLTSIDTAESVEELRLLLLEHLCSYVELAGPSIGDYIEDYVNILNKTLVDSFAEVVKMSCECIKKLAMANRQKFYLQGESLIPSLLKSISHHLNKVRQAILETIGLTVKATSGKTVDDIFPHLAQRTFDHSPPVRLMLVNVVGDWLLNLTDRYSFFPKLIPILLSGFSDEMQEIREKSLISFQMAGKQYEDENEKDFKEKKEYAVSKHYEYMIDYERPILGCRALVHRNISKILPAVANDIADWNLDTKIKVCLMHFNDKP